MREMTLVNFKSGKMPTMLATDIAARGIHVNNIEYVINYDFPCSLDQVWITLVGWLHTQACISRIVAVCAQVRPCRSQPEFDGDSVQFLYT